MTEKNHETAAAFISLFASGATLICCALPALLVTLGLGAVVAGLISNVPGIIWFSENKTLLFTASGLILLVAGIMRYRFSPKTCPADPRQARTCSQMKKISGIIFWLSAALYIIGFFFAFLIKYFI